MNVNILVVDDLNSMRRILRNMLDKVGYTILEASNGLECLNMLRTQNIDLLILDLMMPSMDGLETMKKIREIYHDKKLPVITITGFADKETILKMLNLGCTDFIIKPFDDEELLKRIRKYLGGPGSGSIPPITGSEGSSSALPDRNTVEVQSDPEPEKFQSKQKTKEDDSFQIYTIWDIPAEKLEEGMILAGDLRLPQGLGLLASDGVKLSAKLIEKIRQLGIPAVQIKFKEVRLKIDT